MEAMPLVILSILSLTVALQNKAVRENIAKHPIRHIIIAIIGILIGSIPFLWLFYHASNQATGSIYSLF